LALSDVSLLTRGGRRRRAQSRNLRKEDPGIGRRKKEVRYTASGKGIDRKRTSVTVSSSRTKAKEKKSGAPDAPC